MKFLTGGYLAKLTTMKTIVTIKKTSQGLESWKLREGWKKDGRKNTFSHKTELTDLTANKKRRLVYKLSKILYHKFSILHE